MWTLVTAGPLAGHPLLLDVDGPPWQRDMRDGRYEAFLYDAIADRDLHGAVVWDVGAHIGYHTLTLAARVGERGHVVAVEPTPINLERLRLHLASDPVLASRITVVTDALAARTGSTEIVVGPSVDAGTSSGSRLPGQITTEDAPHFAAFERITVPMTTVDELVERGLPAPQVMKIDVEGAELLVLEGARRVLASARPMMLIEVHGASTMLRLVRWLDDAGYTLTLIDEPDTSPGRCHVRADPDGERDDARRGIID